jgi:DNA-directed RNA polymerase specialized sigma24 family protein
MNQRTAVASLSETGYLTDADIVQRINSIDAAAAVRLERIAAVYIYGTEWSAADLLQEAFVAALERREWRADLDTVVFLTGVMRSLAYSKRKHGKVSALDRAASRGRDDQDAQLQEIPDGEENRPDRILETHESLSRLVERLTACFAGDAQAERVIRGRAAGEEASAIRADLGLNQSQYETVCRRLLRGYQAQVKVNRP